MGCGGVDKIVVLSNFVLLHDESIGQIKLWHSNVVLGNLGDVSMRCLDILELMLQWKNCCHDVDMGVMSGWIVVVLITSSFLTNVLLPNESIEQIKSWHSNVVLHKSMFVSIKRLNILELILQRGNCCHNVDLCVVYFVYSTLPALVCLVQHRE